MCEHVCSLLREFQLLKMPFLSPCNWLPSSASQDDPCAIGAMEWHLFTMVSPFLRSNGIYTMETAFKVAQQLQRRLLADSEDA